MIQTSRETFSYLFVVIEIDKEAVDMSNQGGVEQSTKKEETVIKEWCEDTPE